jgi:hypothetical protein
LTVANRDPTTSAELVEVKATQYPHGIAFKQVLETLESVPAQGEKTVSFTFDVGCPAGIGQNPTDTLKFLISDRSGATWERFIFIRYALPTNFALEQNYPNPFNPTSTIRYALPLDAKVSLKLYDVLGREVLSLVEDNMPAGYHETIVDGSKLSSGIYFYRLDAGSFTQVRKLVVLK